MTSPVVGRAAIEITSDLGAFATETESKVRESMAGLDSEINAGFEKTTADSAAAGAKTGAGFGNGIQTQVGGTMSKLSSSLKSQFGGMAKLAVGAFAVAGISGFFSQSIQGWQDHQRILRQTQAVVESTGGAANLSAADFDNLSSAIEANTGVDGDAVLEAENLLATFTNVKNEVGAGNDIFNQATSIMVDMAAAMGTDAKGGAIQLGKALNDPIKGVGALSKVGVTFTDQQKEQIKTMADAGQMAEAQKVILGELSKEFGGSAAAQETSSQKMMVAYHALQDSVGEGLAPVMESLTSFLTTEVIPAFTATVHFVQDNATTFKILTAVVLGVWLAFKAYEVVKAAYLAIGNFGLAYDRMITRMQTGNAVQRTTATGLQTITAQAGKAGAALAGVGAGIGLGMLTRDASGAKQAVGALSATALGAAAGFAVGGGFGAAIGASAGLVSDLVTTFTGASASSKQFAADEQNLTQAILANNGAITDNVRITAAKALQDQGLLDVFTRLGFNLRDVTAAATGDTDAMTELTSRLQTLKDEGKLSDVMFAELSGSVRSLASTSSGAVTNSNQLADATNAVTNSQTAASGAVADTTGQVKQQTTALDRLSKALQDISGDTIDAKQQELQLQDSLHSLTKGVKDNGTSLDENTAKGRANKETILGLIGDINSHAESVAKQTGSVKEATAALGTDEAQLRKTAVAAGFTKGEVDKLITTYAATPADVRTYLHADTADAQTAVDNFVSHVDALHGTITINARSATGVSLFGSGTPSAPPGWAIVGDEGPELMNLRGGEEIKSNSDSANFMRSYSRGGASLDAVSVGNRTPTVRGPVPVTLTRGSDGELRAYIKEIVFDDGSYNAARDRMGVGSFDE